MKKIQYKFWIAGLAVVMLAGCTKKLDLVPTNDITASAVYSTPAGYKQALAKVYGAMALTGNNGPAGSADISSQIIADEGNSDFLRMLWYLQSLSTDEAGWTYHNTTDPLNIHQLSWSSVNQTVGGLYYRCYFQITLCNDFINQCSDDNLAARGITGSDADEIRKYKQEARFLRAYQYWVLMDLFGNVPFVTEKDIIGSGLPNQIKRTDLFAYVESELKDLETTLPDPKTNEYGRADKAAAWALLSRIYLNAEVYAGVQKYTEAITYCKKIIDAGYTLHPKYDELMLADNNLNTDEFIFTINYDGTNTQNYGGTTTLCHGPAGVPGSISGTNGTWNCIRVTQQFVDLFGSGDMRGQFYTQGQNKVMTQLLDVSTDGYSSTKFRNVTRDGSPAPHADQAGNFSDVDFPVFRLGEIYLTYAEAVLRGGTGGDITTALGYVNQLRKRAYNGTSGNINSSELTLPFILDERGRELFWECLRRTDLIRYNEFTTGAYLWAWKGGVASGSAVDDKYNLYPIPSTDLTANPNLVQNKGY
ncbi:MAG TPA: RagB/SusD family nutrient uptake outer membrane protein [Chitinophagaceae bacterium]|nr:RagB/SusD family nutrient uptake outer membrane protein [Chitinophagaceae bacterium]